VPPHHAGLINLEYYMDAVWIFSLHRSGACGRDKVFIEEKLGNYMMCHQNMTWITQKSVVCIGKSVVFDGSGSEDTSAKKEPSSKPFVTAARAGGARRKGCGVSVKSGEQRAVEGPSSPVGLSHPGAD
jgi:hypothetical protein